MRTNHGKVSGKNPERIPNTGNLEMVATVVTASDVATHVGVALWTRFGRTRDAVKTIARTIKATPRTVEEWLTGESAPSSAMLIRLMSEVPEVFDAVCELAGKDPAPQLTEVQREAAENLLRLLGKQ